MRDLGSVLPAAGVSVSLVFAALAWSAHHRAQRSGETGFAALFGSRQRFDPMDVNPKAAAVQEASVISLPSREAPARFDPLPQGASRPAPVFAVDSRPAVTIYLAPWSTHCRDAVPQIQRLRGELALRGVTTRVVLGLDSQEHLDAFAVEIGGDLAFEPGTKTSNPAQGVPAFVAEGGSRVGAFDSDGEASAWALGRLGR